MNKDNKHLIWNVLIDVSYFKQLIENSNETTFLIFKHSTRCPVSMMAKRRLESDWKFTPHELLPVYLDLIAHRDISNAIAELFSVRHESPQILVIKNGKCVYHASHEDIEVANISY